MNQVNLVIVFSSNNHFNLWIDAFAAELNNVHRNSTNHLFFQCDTNISPNVSKFYLCCVNNYAFVLLHITREGMYAYY